jgi:AcrR family transcriptional regulator
MAATRAPADPGGTDARPSTHDRLLQVALVSFAGRGYEATSLDAIAAELGVRKQTILYYHPTKADLLDAVLEQAAGQLAEVLVAATSNGAAGFERVRSVVVAVFRLAIRRPELLGLVGEVSRLGPDATTRLVAPLEPLARQAEAWLAKEMEAGRLRPSDPELLLLSLYAAVVGVATEVELTRAFGVEITLRSMMRRRRELLRFLHAALVPEPSG